MWWEITIYDADTGDWCWKHRMKGSFMEAAAVVNFVKGLQAISTIDYNGAISSTHRVGIVEFKEIEARD